DRAATEAGSTAQPRSAHGDELGEAAWDAQLARIGACQPALRLPQLDVVEERGSPVVLLPGRHMPLQTPPRQLRVASLRHPRAHRGPPGDQCLVREIDPIVVAAGGPRGGRIGERDEAGVGEDVEHLLECAIVVTLAAQVCEPELAARVRAALAELDEA